MNSFEYHIMIDKIIYLMKVNYGEYFGGNTEGTPQVELIICKREYHGFKSLGQQSLMYIQQEEDSGSWTP